MYFERDFKMLLSNRMVCLLLLAFNTIWLTTGANSEHQGTSAPHYTITCDPGAEPDCHDQSLEQIATGLNQQSAVGIDITAPQLQLDTNVTFSQLHSLSIFGDESNLTTINCTDDNTGLVLENIAKIVLRNLVLSHCGTFTQSKYNRTYSSALIIQYGTNVNISDVAIIKSRGVGLTILHHQGGEVIIRSTTFRENKLPEKYQADTITSPTQVRGGGGIYIGAFAQMNPDSMMSFEFDSCNFVSNTAYTRYYDYLYTDNAGKVKKGHGRGGGAYISLRNGLRNVHVKFVNCNFSTNKAFLGGGLSVKISGGNTQQTTSNVRVEIVDSIFEYNGCKETKRAAGFGGGVHLSFDAFKGSKTTNCQYVLSNVSLSKNCAQVGGGVLYFSSRQNVLLSSDTNVVLFDDCKFMHNKAHMGSAVNMMPNVFQRLSTGHKTVPRFRDCVFLENTVFVNHTHSQQVQRTAGVGTIYASLYDICFEGSTSFENNWGSAVYVVNGIADFTNSSAEFINNTGVNGGAVALIGVSLLKVGANEYRFVNNTALYRGGAIYALMIDNNDFTTSRSCFIQDQNVIFSAINFGNFGLNFSGNKAKDNTTGHAIFATTLIPCLVINNGTPSVPHYKVIDAANVFSARGISLSLDEVATEGAHLDSSDSIRKIIPGEQYNHNVTVTDDLGNTVGISLRAMMPETATGVKLNPAFSSIIGDKIQLVGEPHNRANITLQTVSLRQAYIKMEVELIECPPGFKLNKTSNSCVCNAEAYVALYKCNMGHFYSHLKPGFWAGLVWDKKKPNETELSTTICPFCDYSNAKFDSSGVILPRDKLELTNHVCGNTRTGTLCGSCRPNYTVHYHSPNFLCKLVKTSQCELGWLFYILSELVPVTVVFITVLVLNISFTSGAVNGFILFCQLIGSFDVDATGVISRTFPQTVRNTINYPTQVYQVIYGFFNLDFFNLDSLSFCLWNGATALDMLAIKYVTILYTLLLIVVLICIINNCGGSCIGKCCRITTVKSSVIHGISTFLIISYGQCIRVSLSLLISIDLYIETDSKLRPGTRVWYDGDMLYFSKQHLPYALPALFCLLTVGLVPPALLLIYPLLNKILDVLGFDDDSKIYAISRKLPIGSLKPLLDSFQGCFKDSLRFFAGLYFLYRWPILLVYMNTTSFSTFYMIVGGILVVLLALHAISQPYIKRAHNIIDVLLLTDLVLINGLSFLNYYRTRLNKPRYQRDSTVTPARIQLVLIYLPLVIMGVYTLFIVSKYLKKKGCKDQKGIRFVVPQRARMLRELAQSISALEHEDELDDEEELPHRLLAGEINYAYFEDSD